LLNPQNKPVTDVIGYSYSMLWTVTMFDFSFLSDSNCFKAVLLQPRYFCLSLIPFKDFVLKSVFTLSFLQEFYTTIFYRFGTKPH